MSGMFRCAVAFSAVLLIGGSASAKLVITSTAFPDGGSIPAKYSCDTDNPPNPPLAFSGVPKNAKSLVLIVEDIDIPTSMMPAGVFDHWIVVDISPDSKGFKEGEGAQGVNGMGKPGYIGPCPPDREHRYVFTLYALDTKLGDAKVTNRKEFEASMKSHIIEKAEYLGRYPKAKK
jgi:Raf kinase inhibitor-like YbhB/YbcL family protein